MKSVLVVTPCVAGGLPTQGSIVARQLREDGMDTGILTRAASGLGRLFDIVLRVPLLAPRYDILLVDVFGERAFVYESFAILFGWIYGRRTVAVVHNGMLPDFVRRWPRWTRFVLSRATVVVAPHGFLRDRLSAASIRIDGVIPNFIDIDKYSFRRRSPLRPRFLFIRGLNRIYNPAMTLRAFAMVQRVHPDASLTMAGQEGSESQHCRDLVAELGLRNVEFTGIIPKAEVPRVADRHDIHLHSNRFENMPVSVIEMWACGLPIVGTDVGGMRYLVTDEVDALLVPSEDHEAMAAAALRLLSDASLAERLSTNGRKRAEMLTWARVRGQWDRVLNGVPCADAQIADHQASTDTDAAPVLERTS
jgi:glycosyltransferase involved in cell wall biosynthesis